MAALEKIRFFILKRTKFSEADLILQTLTPQGGKLSCLARGALKSKKRFNGGVLEPTHFVEAVIRPSAKADGLATVEEAKLIEAFEGLRTSYDRLETALQVAQIVDKVAQPNDQNSHHLFDLLGHTLRALQTAPSTVATKAQFELKFLYHQGVLEVEPWMGEYLKMSLSDLASKSAAPLSAPQIKWIDSQIDTYLKTAERF
ncbi:MAG: DNA repair protein RecO [Bdellovibrionaceae bacterium]|nr:DNA repair protein RecO [Pseudobdellovibrionaceae bacterium]